METTITKSNSETDTTLLTPTTISETKTKKPEDYTDRERIEIGIIEIKGKETKLKDFVQLSAEKQSELYTKTVNWVKSLQDKIDRHNKLVQKQILSEKFKDYQRRSQLGLLTPEELKARENKKEEDRNKWINKRK